LDELLNERDRRGNIDDDVLAYTLGSISYDSSDFRRTTDILSFKSIEEVPSSWKAEIDKINKVRSSTQPPGEPVRLEQLLNKPKLFAEVVWGWEKNQFGNNRGRDGKYDSTIGEGWTYRERGIYQQIGYEQYDEDAKWLKQDDPSFTIDVVKQPDAMSNAVVSARVAFARLLRSKSDGATRKDQRSTRRDAEDCQG
jgi:hypothetical protein